MELKATSDQLGRAIILNLACFILFTLLNSSAKYLVGMGFSVSQVVMARYAGHLLLMLVFIAPFIGRGIWHCNEPYWVMVRGVMLFLMTFFNFWALRYLPLTTTAAILITTPILVCLLSVPLLGEKIGFHRWIAVFLGLLGVVVIIRPFSVEIHPAIFLSIGMAICMALYTIITRKLAGREHPHTQQLYVSVVAVVCLLPISMANIVNPNLDSGEWKLPVEIYPIFLFTIMCLLGWLGHQFLIAAYHYAQASALAPFTYTQFIFMAFASWLFYDEIPDLPVFIGAFIIAISGLYIWHRENIHKRSPT